MINIMEIIRLVSAGLAWLVTAGCVLAALYFFVTSVNSLKKAYKYRHSEELKHMDLETAALTMMMAVLAVVFGIAAALVALSLSGGITI